MENHPVEWQNQLLHYFYGYFQEQTVQLAQGNHGEIIGEKPSHHPPIHPCHSLSRFLSGELSEEALPAELLQGSLEPLVTNTLEECEGMVALFMVAEATLLKRSCWHCVLFKYGEALDIDRYSDKKLVNGCKLGVFLVIG